MSFESVTVMIPPGAKNSLSSIKAPYLDSRMLSFWFSPPFVPTPAG